MQATSWSRWCDGDGLERAGQHLARRPAASVECLQPVSEGVVGDESAPDVCGHAVFARILPETRDVTEDRQVGGLVLANRVASLPGGEPPVNFADRIASA